MAASSKIEWTDSTFNPWIGCTKVGPGCDHCYAERDWDLRRHRVRWGAGQPRSRTSEAAWNQPLRWNAEPFVVCGDIDCGRRAELRSFSITSFFGAIGYQCPDCGMWQPNLKEVRRRVFCASLADWLDKEVPIGWLTDLLDLVRQTPNLDWLLLTKRIGIARERLKSAYVTARERSLEDLSIWLGKWISGHAPSNAWVGETFCNQKEWNRDADKLFQFPAALHFGSFEPLLGDIDLDQCPYCDGSGQVHDSLSDDGLTKCTTCAGLGQRKFNNCADLGWVIAGGESGPKARPSHPDWYRSLRDQCAAAGVPFLFKQWGEFAEANIENVAAARASRFIELSGDDSTDWTLDRHGPLTAHMVNIGKKSAGRLLDGIEHNGFPEVQ